MKIGVIQASSQVDKNQLLVKEVKRAVSHKNWQVFNFGVFEGGKEDKENEELSYIQIALSVGLLLNSGAIDFVVTGCSSGNGMAIAANSLPNVICGYLPSASDAFLFGRINQGNCASLPLGLNFGWAGEVNLRYTLEALFTQPMDTGYPAESAERKRRDAKNFKKIKKLSQTNMIEIFKGLDSELVNPIFAKEDLMEFLLENSTNEDLKNYLENEKRKYESY